MDADEERPASKRIVADKGVGGRFRPGAAIGGREKLVGLPVLDELEARGGVALRRPRDHVVVAGLRRRGVVGVEAERVAVNPVALDVHRRRGVEGLADVETHGLPRSGSSSEAQRGRA